MGLNNTFEQNLSKTSNEEAMNCVIPVKPAIMDNENRIAVFIPNQTDVIDLIKKVPQSRWSPTHKCWHFLKTQQNWDIFTLHFKDFTLNIQKNMPPLSIPASEMWEKPKLQLKADYLNHFILPTETVVQNAVNEKKEDTKILFVHKTPYQLEKIVLNEQKYLGVPIPSTDNISREIIKKIEGRIWHPQEYMWLVPYSQLIYDKLKSAFEGKLIPPTNKEFRLIQPPVFEPKLSLKPKTPKEENISLFDRLNGKQQLAVTKFEELLIEERKTYETRKGYRNVLIQFLYQYPDTMPSQITHAQIKAYILKRIKEENISKSTQNHLVSTFKAFYGRLLNQYDKVENLYRPEKEQHLPKTLTPDEVARLLKQVGNLKHKCMLMLMYGSGLRVGELVRLRHKDLDFIEKTVFVDNGKHYKDRFSILSEKSIAYLKKYFKEHKPTPVNWVFESPDGGHYSTRSVQLIFAEALAKAKINKQVSTHSLRHTFATELVKSTSDLDFVRKVLGHASILTTQIYLHVIKSQLTVTRSPLDDLDI